MCVLEIIWETIERNCTKEIKCIIKVWYEKYLRELIIKLCLKWLKLNRNIISDQKICH